jgi:hypothetical protein
MEIKILTSITALVLINMANILQAANCVITTMWLTHVLLAGLNLMVKYFELQTPIAD